MSRQRTVLITGCSPGGIGHALALEFHAAGLRVFATARSASTLADLAAHGLETLSLDVTDDAAILRLRAELDARTAGAGLDLLVNNAGRNYTVPALDADMAEVRATFDTNVFALMRVSQVFAPMLVRAAQQQQDHHHHQHAGFAPTILHIGSLAAVMPYVFGGVYNASKAAVHAFADAQRLELAPFGVRVLVAVTGGVRSNIARVDRRLPPDSLYRPLEAAYAERLVHSQTNGVPAAEYARVVVRQVLVPGGAGDRGWWGIWGARKEVWAGGSATLVWLVRMLLPRRVLDWAFMRMFGLWKLTGTAARRKGA